MVRRNTEQSGQIDQQSAVIDRLNTTVERLELVIKGLTRQILAGQENANRHNPHLQAQQQNNNNNNGQPPAQPAQQQQQQTGDPAEEDAPPPPPPEEDDDMNGAGDPPSPLRGPQPSRPRFRTPRIRRNLLPIAAQVPPLLQQQQQQPLPPVADMLRNDFVPDIPRALPKNMIELLEEYERKNLGQYTGNQRHWETRYRTMWSKWHYLYHRLVLTANYANFRPNTPMDQMHLRMSLAAMDFETRRKNLKKSVSAFGKFLHKDDPAISRRNRGG
jgi:outer membrane murein-binding lipoprotein Lpp